jgi:hypothetical protein
LVEGLPSLTGLLNGVELDDAAGLVTTCFLVTTFNEKREEEASVNYTRTHEEKEG